MRKLHIGAGPHLLEGWLNGDIEPWFLGHLRNHSILLDATKRFPFADDTFDYIFTEHMIEHVDYSDGFRMLQECYRVLKPGGHIRIATPDLEKLVRLYDPSKGEVENRYIRWAVDKSLSHIGVYEPGFVINNFFRKWGHRFIYDRSTLHYAMRQTGFIEIVPYAPRESENPALRELERHGETIGEEMNRFETMVLEGRRPN
jgi:predicted SAM-dependent methyltransferase